MNQAAAQLAIDPIRQTITLGNRQYALAPLGYPQALRIYGLIVAHEKKFPPGSRVTLDGMRGKIDIAVAMLHAALSPAYPLLTKREVIECVDLDNVAAIIDAITKLTIPALGEHKPTRSKQP